MGTAEQARPAGEIHIASAVLMTAVGGYIDAFLFLRHEVFGFAQTGNVVFMAVNLVKGANWVQYVWPLVAFVVGVSCAQIVRTYFPQLPNRVIASTMAFQLIVFAVLALIPASSSAVIFILSLSFVGGVRLELFRTAGGISFVSIATTGNLMRMVEMFGEFIKDRSLVRMRAAGYAVAVVAGFFGGAIAGAVLARHFDAALWGAVALEAVSLVVFVTDARRAQASVLPDGYSQA